VVREYVSHRYRPIDARKIAHRRHELEFRNIGDQRLINVEFALFIELHNHEPTESLGNRTNFEHRIRVYFLVRADIGKSKTFAPHSFLFIHKHDHEPFYIRFAHPLLDFWANFICYTTPRGIQYILRRQRGERKTPYA